MLFYLPLTQAADSTLLVADTLRVIAINGKDLGNGPTLQPIALKVGVNLMVIEFHNQKVEQEMKSLSKRAKVYYMVKFEAQDGVHYRQLVLKYSAPINAFGQIKPSIVEGLLNIVDSNGQTVSSQIEPLNGEDKNYLIQQTVPTDEPVLRLTPLNTLKPLKI